MSKQKTQGEQDIEDIKTLNSEIGSIQKSFKRIEDILLKCAQNDKSFLQPSLDIQKLDVMLLGTSTKTLVGEFKLITEFPENLIHGWEKLRPLQRKIEMLRFLDQKQQKDDQEKKANDNKKKEDSPCKNPDCAFCLLKKK